MDNIKNFLEKTIFYLWIVNAVAVFCILTGVWFEGRPPVNRAIDISGFKDMVNMWMYFIQPVCSILLYWNNFLLRKINNAIFNAKFFEEKAINHPQKLSSLRKRNARPYNLKKTSKSNKNKRDNQPLKSYIFFIFALCCALNTIFFLNGLNGKSSDASLFMKVFNIIYWILTAIFILSPVIKIIEQVYYEQNKYKR